MSTTFLIIALAACGPDVVSAPPGLIVPTTPGSPDEAPPLVPRFDAEAWFTDEFEQRVIHVDQEGVIRSLDLPGEPAGVVDIGNGRAAVTLRAVNEVAILAREGDSLSEVMRFAVGVEPFDLALTSEGLWVSASIDHRLELYDPDSGELIDRVDVDCEPRHLLEPFNSELDGLRVVSTCARKPWIHMVQADGVESRALPHRVWPGTEVCRPSHYRPRVHGQPAWHPNGDLLLPAQYLANYAAAGCDIRRGGALDQIRLFEIGFRSREINPIPFNATLVVMPLHRDAPDRTLMTATVTDTGDRRGMLTGVVPDPTDHNQVWLASEGSAGLFWLRLDDPEPEDARNAEPSIAGFEMPVRGWVSTGLGPHRLVALEDRILGYSRLASELLEVDPTKKQVQNVHPFPVTVSAEVEMGRWMFYDGTHFRGSAPDLDVTCASCHIEGRSDGLVWSLAFEAPRRTMPLAGRLRNRTKWTWAALEYDLEYEISDAQGYLLGYAADLEDARDLGKFLSTRRAPQGRKHAPDVVMRGQQVFVDLGCASCHVGRMGTDQSVHNFYGSEVMTPPLVGLVASPPYFHNAGASDLDAVLHSPAMSPGLRTLTPTDQDALLRYLETL